MSDSQTTDDLERLMQEMLGAPKPQSETPAGHSPLSDAEIDALLLVTSGSEGDSA